MLPFRVALPGGIHATISNDSIEMVAKESFYNNVLKFVGEYRLIHTACESLKNSINSMKFFNNTKVDEMRENNKGGYYALMAKVLKKQQETLVELIGPVENFNPRQHELLEESVHVHVTGMMVAVRLLIAPPPKQ